MKAVVLFGHGSRDPAWRRQIDGVAARMREIDAQCLVRCAFLELTQPSLKAVAQELVAQGCQQLVVVPMFLGLGRHAREDLPLLVKELQVTYPAVRFELRPSVGEEPQVIDLLAKLSLY